MSERKKICEMGKEGGGGDGGGVCGVFAPVWMSWVKNCPELR